MGLVRLAYCIHFEFNKQETIVLSESGAVPYSTFINIALIADFPTKLGKPEI